MAVYTNDDLLFLESRVLQALNDAHHDLWDGMRRDGREHPSVVDRYEASCIILAGLLVDSADEVGIPYERRADVFNWWKHHDDNKIGMIDTTLTERRKP